jgi:ribosomal protein L9
MENINALIDAIADNNAVESEKIFNSIMADKIADRLQDYRQDVAANMFNTPEVEESDATE